MPSSIRSPLVLWANSTLNRLHEDWQSSGNLEEVRLTQGDTVEIELHWLKSVSEVGLIHDEVIFPVNANITLAIGRIDAPPEAGVFRLAYGGQQTGSIAYDALPTAVQAALNALTSISSAGGVTVSQTATSYKIVWNNPGVLASTLTTYSNDLLPSSTIGIGLARAGTVSVSGIYTVHIKQAPVAACLTWVPAASTELTVVTESTVGAQRTFKLEFSRLPKGGSFTLSYVWATGGKIGTTLPIEVDSLSPQNIAFAIQQGTNWNNMWFLNVVKRSPLVYAITMWLSAFPVPAPVVSSMSVLTDNVTDFSTKTGLLSLNTVEIESLLAGQSSVEAVLEVEVEVDGSRQTIIQTTALIKNDLIDTDVYDLVEWGSVIPADSVVRYDTSQSLTTGQKTQARNNIGAIDSSALNVLIAKDAELELLISSQNLTVNELAAVKGAATPSGTNLFLTKSGADALYALLAHQHLPAHIIGLQATLDGYSADIGATQASVVSLQSSKANSYHVQPTSTITGLDTILADFDTRIAGFAPFNHTHDIADVTDLETRLAALELFQTNGEQNIPTVSQKAALDNGQSPGALNPFVTESRVNAMISGQTSGLATELYVNTQLTAAVNLLPEQYLTLDSNTPTGAGTNLTNTYFPKEILVTQDGVSYYIPARLA